MYPNGFARLSRGVLSGRVPEEERSSRSVRTFRYLGKN
jgi:hypothetical protein